MLRPGGRQASALTGLELALDLVDHIDPALATNNTACTVAVLQRAKRIPDFHHTSPGTICTIKSSVSPGAVVDGGRNWD